MKKNAGFTMMELMAVIGIIMVLIGIGIPAYNSWRNRGKIAKARATIAKIEMALEMYKTDIGYYPQKESSLYDLNAAGLVNQFLANSFSSGGRTYGPYIKFKTDEITGNVVIDPWGKGYVVYTAPKDPNNTDFRHNTSSYYIYSCGPNGSAADSDDIDNYKPM